LAELIIATEQPEPLAEHAARRVKGQVETAQSLLDRSRDILLANADPALAGLAVSLIEAMGGEAKDWDGETALVKRWLTQDGHSALELQMAALRLGDRAGGTKAPGEALAYLGKALPVLIEQVAVRPRPKPQSQEPENPRLPPPNPIFPNVRRLIHVRCLTPFMFDDAPVRSLSRDGDPWFVAADVCRAIGLTNSRKAVAVLDDEEKGVTLSDTLGGRQEMTIISESGLYALILRSRKAVTPGTLQHRFRKWITAEVIPALRKTGAYRPQPAPARRSSAEVDLLRDLAVTGSVSLIPSPACMTSFRTNRPAPHRCAWSKVWYGTAP
jgi:prophage antirepressor-like protein